MSYDDYNQLTHYMSSPNSLPNPHPNSIPNPSTFSNPNSLIPSPQTFQDSSARVYKKQIGIREFAMPLLGNIVLGGQFMAASAMYGCFMTMSGSFCLNNKLPDNFRVSLSILYSG